MTDLVTENELRARLQDIDARIAELEREARGEASGNGVRDPEEIATDLTGWEEIEAVLAVLRRRRDTVARQLQDAIDDGRPRSRVGRTGGARHSVNGRRQ